MKLETREYIQRVALSLRDSCNVPTPIKDIETLLENMGGTLEAAELATITNKGRIKKDGNHFVIRYLEQLEYQDEINWVVACALGHLVLHLGLAPIQNTGRHSQIMT